VVEQVAAAVVAVHRDQDVAAGVGDPVSGRGAGEAGEHLRVDDAQAGAGQHGDRQFRDHGHVQRHPVACLEPREIAQQGGELVDPDVKLPVRDRVVFLVLRFGHPDEGGLVRLGFQVAVDAVVAGVQLTADEPFPERRGGGVQRGVPRLVPGQQIGIGPEALRELVLAELLDNGWVGRVGLLDELGRRLIIALFAPVHRDVCFGGFVRLIVRVMELVSHIFLASLSPGGVATCHSGRNLNLTRTSLYHHGRSPGT